MRHPVDYAPSQDFGENPTAHLPSSHWIIKTFGNYQPDGHTGIDYPCPVGTPVRAAADGIVRHVGKFGGGYSDNPWWIMPSFAGYTYVVDHGRFIGIYGHCQDGGARVVANQRVNEGQILGLSGNTGASTGPHLHFEVLPGGYVLNSRMYGRINPASLFGGINPLGTTTTPLEDELSAQEVLSWPIERTDGQESTVAIELARLGPDLAAVKSLLESIAPKVDESMVNDRKQVHSLDGLWAAVGSIPASEVAVQLNAAGIAAEVRDELVKLIGGAK